MPYESAQRGPRRSPAVLPNTPARGIMRAGHRGARPEEGSIARADPSLPPETTTWRACSSTPRSGPLFRHSAGRQEASAERPHGRASGREHRRLSLAGKAQEFGPTRCALSTKRGTWIALVFVAVVSALSMNPALKLQEDSGAHLSRRSLSPGVTDIATCSFVGSPSAFSVPSRLSLLPLAPVTYLLGFDFGVMKLAMTGGAVIILVLVAARFRPVTETSRTAALVVLLTGASPAIVYFTHSIMTDILYLLLSLLAVVWIERCAQSGAWTASGIAIAVVALSLVYLTRLIGVSRSSSRRCYMSRSTERVNRWPGREPRSCWRGLRRSPCCSGCCIAGRSAGGRESRTCGITLDRSSP